MINSNELRRAEMPLATLTLFDYVTQGISTEVELDFDVLYEVELDFD